MKGYQWLLTFAVVMLSACSSNENRGEDIRIAQTNANETAVLLKNASPAEVNCTLAGGTMAMSRQLNGSNVGTCQLANGKRCHESAVLSGMCPAG